MTGIPSWARKGAKVVCIDDANVHAGDKHPLLNEGAIYTIDAVVRQQGHVLVELVEVKPHAYDNGWFISRFRPLVTRSQEQDIAEHFAGHLHQRVPEKA